MQEPPQPAARTPPSLSDLRRWILGFAIVFSALAIGVAAIGFAQLREDALASAKRRAQAYSTILSAHLERTLSAIDARLAQIVLQSPRLGGPAGDAAQWQAVLDAAHAGGGAIGSLSVTDANGVIRHSTLRQLVGQGRGDRFIHGALSDPDAPEPMGDAPLISPYSGRVIQPLGRRLRAADGRIVGLVVGTFTPDSLRAFYNNVDTEGGALRIQHVTGAVVFEEPAGSSAPMLDASDPVGAAYRAGRPSGLIMGRLARNGPSLITSYGAVGDTGLIVVVSLDRMRALRAWRDDTVAAGVILVGVLTAFWIAVALMLRQWRAREAAEAALQRQQQLLAQAQRMESLGQLTSGVAHDFNNVLTVIVNVADSMLTRVAHELRPRLEAILSAADNGAALVRHLLAFSRRQALELAPLDVNVVVSSMEEMLRRTIGAAIDIRFVLANGLWSAIADRAQIESALLNLAINARDAMPDGGLLTIETRNAHLDEAYAKQNLEVTPGDYVALAVSDSGVGMSADVLERAMEPFFTTKAGGRGSGLGLSMIYGFAKQAKGHLKIYSEPGRGTTVRLYLPRDTGAAASARALAAGGEDRGGDETVLIVEDDAQVRAVAAAALRERGYEVLEAANGPDAMSILRSQAPVRLLLTDVVLPGALSGKDLAREAIGLRQGLKVLFTSGFADASVLHNGLVEAGARFLAKPYRGRELAAAVRALLDGA